MKRPIRPFKQASKKATAITGPDSVPAPETRAQRVRNLARLPGATLTLLDDRTLDVTCEDEATARAMEHRVRHACALVGVAQYTWTPRPDAPLTFVVDLT